MDKQFSLRAIMMIALVSTITGIGVTPILLQQSAYAGARGQDPQAARNAPRAITGELVYQNKLGTL